MRIWIIAALVGVALLAQGCSNFEPKTGTRVTYTFPGNKPITRDTLAGVSRYLMTKGQTALGVKGPRIDSVTDISLVLLLPGKKIPAADIVKLTQATSIELYHLSNVATRRYPDRPWKLKSPSTPTKSYLFLGPEAKRVDSHKDPQALLREVVGYPKTKPVLTGKDISPTASCRPITNGWAVLVRFTPKGAKIFHDFTKANKGEYLAVFYNGRMLSAPIIEDAIPGGEAYITGFGGEDQARGAVAELNAGDLPIEVKIDSVEYY